jgi:hypothetical protein
VFKRNIRISFEQEDVCVYLKQKKIISGNLPFYRTLIMYDKCKWYEGRLSDGFTRYELIDLDEDHAHHL